MYAAWSLHIYLYIIQQCPFCNLSFLKKNKKVGWGGDFLSPRVQTHSWNSWSRLELVVFNFTHNAFNIYLIYLVQGHSVCFFGIDSVAQISRYAPSVIFQRCCVNSGVMIGAWLYRLDRSKPPCSFSLRVDNQSVRPMLNAIITPVSGRSR